MFDCILPRYTANPKQIDWTIRFLQHLQLLSGTPNSKLLVDQRTPMGFLTVFKKISAIFYVIAAGISPLSGATFLIPLYNLSSTFESSHFDFRYSTFSRISKLILLTPPGDQLFHQETVQVSPSDAKVATTTLPTQLMELKWNCWTLNLFVILHKVVYESKKNESWNNLTHLTENLNARLSCAALFSVYS